MKPIRSRDDLIAYVLDHAPSRACETAIKEGRVRVIGGFEAVGYEPGWALSVTSKHNKMWDLLVTCNEATRSYYLWNCPHGIPPQYQYTGTRNGPRPLIDGDSC